MFFYLIYVFMYHIIIEKKIVLLEDHFWLSIRFLLELEMVFEEFAYEYRFTSGMRNVRHFSDMYVDRRRPD